MAGETPSTQPHGERSRASTPWVISAFLLFGATLAMRFPGVAGIYADGNPPLMARTWALLNHLRSGTEPFFLVQMLLWWGGIGAISAALGRGQRHGAAALVLLVGIAPLWLGWATVLLGDAQLACCLVGASGLLAHWRLDARREPRWARGLAILLIAYATLVRANAAFATIPFVLALFDWPRLPKLWHKAAALIALIGAVLVFSPVLNDHILGARPTGVESKAPLYDMAGPGIAHLNSGLRFWVGPGEPDADPPLSSAPNPDGLGAPANPGGEGLIAAAHLMAISPLGWPVVWLVVSAGLLWASMGLTDPQPRLGRALAGSALCMGASFALVGIGSDLRYHLWSMVAAALALVLLLDTRRLDRRRGFVAGGVLVAVIALGTIARLGGAGPAYVPLPQVAPPPPSAT